MDNNIISIGVRTASVKNMKSSLSSLGVSTLILASDLAWFFFRRSRHGGSSWWEYVILVISGLFFLFALLGIMFTSSNNSFHKKVVNEPLIGFDTQRKVFIVQSFTEFKQMEFDLNDVKGVSVSVDDGQVTFKFTKNGKDKETYIGFTDITAEKELNEKIKEIQNEYNN